MSGKRALHHVSAGLSELATYHRHVARIIRAQLRVGRAAFGTTGEFVTADYAASQHELLAEAHAAAASTLEALDRVQKS